MKKSLELGKKGKIEIKKLNITLPGQVFSLLAKSINATWEFIDRFMTKFYTKSEDIPLWS